MTKRKARVNPKQIRVRGYTRSNGTKVKPHNRTVPNDKTSDNLKP